MADLALIETEGQRIIEIGQGAPAATVPQYPTWTLRDLVVHVAGVHGRTAEICRTLPRERIPTMELPSGRDAFGWAAEQLAAMLEGLRTADPDAATWTFVADPCLRFWGPRMAVETGVHRWDAESAIGNPQPLPAEVAVHGLDEFSELYLPRLGGVPAIELVAIDLGRRWRYGAGTPVATVEGTASDLFLRLMSRPGVALPIEWERAVDALASPADR